MSVKYEQARIAMQFSLPALDEGENLPFAWFLVQRAPPICIFGPDGIRSLDQTNFPPDLARFPRSFPPTRHMSAAIECVNDVFGQLKGVAELQMAAVVRILNLS